MAKKLGGLGRGLDALFQDYDKQPAEKADSPLTFLRLADIEPDKTQPRKHFDAAALDALTDSVRQHGVLQPLVVRPAASVNASAVEKQKLDGKYRIVSGERRWRAAKAAGLAEVPVVIKVLSDKEAGAIMLIENLQREDLNPVETARGFKRLIDEFELTQEETASLVGVSRPALTNSLRLLSLPEKVLAAVENGTLSAGHARTLLALPTEKDILAVFAAVQKGNLSVRATEAYVKAFLKQRQKDAAPKKAPSLSERAYMDTLAERFSSRMGRKSRLVCRNPKKGDGKLEIEFYGREDLEALLKTLCGNDFFDD